MKFPRRRSHELMRTVSVAFDRECIVVIAGLAAWKPDEIKPATFNFSHS